MKKNIKIITLCIVVPQLLISNEWNAQTYHANFSVQFQKGTEVIDKWQFKGNENILDVGCGNGVVTAEIAKKTVGRVVGTDASNSMITFAQQHPSNMLPNLSFTKCSATNLNFSQEFDLVFSLNCLHWVKDKQQAFDAIYKALKPNGKFIFLISVQPPSGEYPLLAIADTMKATPKWKALFTNYTWPIYLEKAEVFVPMFSNCGFEIKNFECAYKGVEFKEPEGILQHLRGLTWLNNLSDEKKEEFLQELVQTYIKDKTSPYPYSVYQIYGVVEKPA